MTKERLNEIRDSINAQIRIAKDFDYGEDLLEILNEEKELYDYTLDLQKRIKELETINEEHRRINGELRKTINEAIEYLEYQIPQLDFEKDIKARILGAMVLVLLQGKSDE